MGMGAVLARAACFIAIIILGYSLRKIDFFHEGDFQVLSKIVLKITLPAAIVVNFSSMELSPSMLVISLIGFCCSGLYVVLAILMNLRNSKERQAFEIINLTAYNIGNFTLPFVQNFLGPVGVVVTSLFDTGNAVVCLGGAYSVASIVKGDNGGISLKNILKPLLSSVPFDTYLIMTALCLLHLHLPEPVVSFAGIISNANAFMAMLMIGVGFKLSGDREQMGAIVRILLVRYGTAAALALACYFLIPFPLEYRQTLAILTFAPIASAAPAFTASLKGDIGLSSAINSMSIVISIFCIVGVLGIVL